MCEDIKEIECSSDNSVDDEFTFENFIVGESNKFAYDLALAVAEGRNKLHYNPLYIYGESGLGKTHLLHAVRNHIKTKYPERNVAYINGFEFIEELVLYIKQDKINEFREKYTSPDILLVDDTQFLEGWSATQQEFLYIYNALLEHGKQIIFTADKPVEELYKVADTVRTRLISGISAQILPYDKILHKSINKMYGEKL